MANDKYGESNCSVMMEEEDIVIRVHSGRCIGKAGEWKKPNLADPDQVGKDKAAAYQADPKNMRRKDLIGTTGGFSRVGRFGVSVNVTAD